MPKKTIPQQTSQEPGIHETLIDACRKLNHAAQPDLLNECALRLVISSVHGGVQDRPAARQKGGTRAKAHLAKMAATLARLARQFHDMTYEAEMALELIRVQEREAATLANEGKPFPALRRKAPGITMMEFYVQEYCLHVLQAHTMLDESPATPGRQAEHQKTAITQMVCQVYQLLTGKPGTLRTTFTDHKAYGPLHEFLTEVFGILNVDASADGQLHKIKKPSPSRKVNASRTTR